MYRIVCLVVALLFAITPLLVGDSLANECALSNHAKASCKNSAEDHSRRPNVIVIVADDLGWADISPYGNVRSITPNLQRLAKTGVLFTDFYVSSSICSPSRAGYFTGLSPGRTGIFDTLHFNHKAFHYNTVKHLPLSFPNIASMFKATGYKTGHFGKWHLGDHPDSPSPKDYGIDREFTFQSKTTRPSISVSLTSDPHHFGKLDGMVVDEALDFMDDNRNQPFFANIWTYIPHLPLRPTQKQRTDFDKAQGKLNVLSEARNPYQKSIVPTQNTAAQTYFASIMEMDRQIGRVLDKLDELGIRDNTIVVFFSDNGPEKMSQPSTSNFTFGNTGPFRGRKFSLYEGGLRVPAIISWKGVFGENIVDQTSVVSSLDLMATFAKLIDSPMDIGKTDGEDVLPAFLGLGHERDSDLFWYFPKPYSTWGPMSDISPVLAIRAGRYKLLTNINDDHVELYDVSMDVDPFELNNLALVKPDLAKELRERALDHYRSLNAPDNAYHNSKHGGKRHFFHPKRRGRPIINYKDG